MEYLTGTVGLHVLIGTDGAVKQIQLFQGACSLAKAATEAVRQWQYRPTTINGNPVEVDTTVNVVFSLKH